jgi:hypothetical protein
MKSAAIAVGVALALGVLLYHGSRSLVGVRWGRIALLVGVAVLPLGATGLTLVHGTQA